MITQVRQVNSQGSRLPRVRGQRLCRGQEGEEHLPQNSPASLAHSLPSGPHCGSSAWLSVPVTALSRDPMAVTGNEAQAGDTEETPRSTNEAGGKVGQMSQECEDKRAIFQSKSY